MSGLFEGRKGRTHGRTFGVVFAFGSVENGLDALFVDFLRLTL